MLKAVGMLLVVLCSSMSGGFLASGLSGKVSALEESIRLLGFMGDRLRYLQPSIMSLMETVGTARRFESLRYPEQCLRLMRCGGGFSESWRSAVHGCRKTLGEEESEILAGLGDILGLSDLDSQLASLDYMKEMLSARLDTAREDRAKYTKLYRTLGVLCGVAVAILFI